jgi:hypothetical protein
MVMGRSDIPIVEDFHKVPEGIDLDLILDCEFGQVKWAVYTTAVEYGVLDHLDEPLQAEELADRAGFHSKVTEYLLDTLTSLGLLIKQEGRYENSPTARRVLSRWDFVLGSVKWDPFWGRLGRMLAGERLEPLGGEGKRSVGIISRCSDTMPSGLWPGSSKRP